MTSALLASAVLYAALGAWALAARPSAATNRTLAAFLLLFAGAQVSYDARLVARTDADTAVAALLVLWYEIPASFAFLLLVDLLFLPTRRGPWRWALLLAAGAFTLAGVGALALAPELLVAGADGPLPIPGPLGSVHRALLSFEEALAMILAVAARRSPDESPLQGEQRAVVLLAFSFLFARSAGDFAVRLVLSPRSYLGEHEALHAVADLFWVLVVVATERRLSRAFHGRRLLVLRALLAAPVLSGAVDGVLATVTGTGHGEAVAGLPWTRAVWFAAGAVTLAVAIVRYGLAGYRRDAPRRLANVTGILLLLALAGAGTALVVARFGLSPVGVALALGAVGLPFALPLTPLADVPHALSRRVVPDPSNPDVAGERIRIYTLAVRAARAGDGGISPHAEEALRALRDDLGLTERDHALILAMGSAPPVAGAAAAAPAAEEGDGALLGRYLVEREIGRGGSSVALLATDTVTGRRVVVKRLRSGTRSTDLLGEARALAKVAHPRVLRLFAAERVGEDVLLVLEHAPGGSLADRLAREGPLEPDAALEILEDVLSALEAVHAARLVHGDVKPENVLFATDRRAKLADFGSARLTPDIDVTLTRAPPTATLAAMAPEQASGGRATPLSDLYAAGALLFRSLTGEHYLDFSNGGELELRERIRKAPPRLPHPGVPRHLERLIANSLAKEPGDRFASAGAMREAARAARGVAKAAAEPRR